MKDKYRLCTFRDNLSTIYKLVALIKFYAFLRLYFLERQFVNCRKKNIKKLIFIAEKPRDVCVQKTANTMAWMT